MDSLREESADGDIASNWKKSSYSHATGNCVEVASMPGGGVGVRDSKSPEGGILRFSPGKWAGFVRRVSEAEFR
ncbi:MAG: DUF397 domain-containing protein [Nocardiopsaceae bacterium]|nr:DUF397 domain-containing protein [Nocardiopsaceae bacterium]